MDLYKGSYAVLSDRITGQGYAVTSLTGAYVGMFTRDSSIQAMAHIAHGDADAARKILKYLFSCHAALGARRAVHIIDDLREEAYGNDYLAPLSNGGQPVGRACAQRAADVALYSIVAPDNGAAQPFVPEEPRIYAVEVHLNRSAPTDTVRVSVCTDYRDPGTAVGTALYTFGRHENGWQCIEFDAPVPVTPGQTYYLVLQTVKASGAVSWNGVLSGEGPNSHNYDRQVFGGWVEKPYHPAFEIVFTPREAFSQRFTARSGVLQGAEARIFASSPGGRMWVEVRADRTDPSTALCRAQRQIAAAGEQTLVFSFDGAAVTAGKRYDLVAGFEDCGDCVRVLSAFREGEAAALGGEWTAVRSAFELSPVFDCDRQRLTALEKGVTVIEEIPASGENITTLKILLDRDPDVSGTVTATLKKVSGDLSQTVGVLTVPAVSVPQGGGWVVLPFGLPLTKPKKNGSYRLELNGDVSGGKVYLCGTTALDGALTAVNEKGESAGIPGTGGYEALRGQTRLISDYTQTDTTYMLLHAWAMYAGRSGNKAEDRFFIGESYPLVKTFANFFIDSKRYYNDALDLIFNPSLEHSRKGRYWQSYDLITNVFASQALRELSAIAEKTGDSASAEKWKTYSEKIKGGIERNLTAEYDGKTIYAEFYDAENGMTFYPGISWVNFAPVAAEWYGTDPEIMMNTYEVYKKHAGIRMLGYNGLATDATLGTNEIRRELIGKGVAWELMFCRTVGDEERIREILALERATAKKYRLSVYPESWTSQTTVSDPGNQEHCAWQVYAMTVVFPELNASE
ncbi:MAG: hypothetical protein IJU52_01265 [Clostridia bacterium]|nr:hypothetical protein [Clostridia bacterium]